MAKQSVAVFFGGMSSEHDISCISAQTVAGGLDRDKYNVILVGITKEGRWQVWRTVPGGRAKRLPCCFPMQRKNAC